MPAPLSDDLRKRIISANLKGDTGVHISSSDSVHPGTVTKQWSLYRATRSYSPRPNPSGRKPALSPEQLDEIRVSISEQPDITLQELKDKFGLPVSLSVLSKTLRNKKTLYPSEQHREDITLRRKAWKSVQPEMKIEHPVFIDENSIDTGMTRLYRRAASNERVIDCTPDTRMERITVLSSIRTSGDTVPLI